MGHIPELLPKNARPNVGLGLVHTAYHNFLPSRKDGLEVHCPEVRNYRRQLGLLESRSRCKEAADYAVGDLCTVLQAVLSCLLRDVEDA